MMKRPDSLREPAQTLLETDRAFAEMSRVAGAAAAFGHYLAEDAMMMPGGGHPVVGRAAIAEAMKQGTYSLLWEPRHAETSASGDLGWSWGEYVMRIRDEGGGEQVRHGKYVNVWTLTAEGWRVRVDIGNLSPAP